MKTKGELQLFSTKNKGAPNLVGEWVNELGSVMRIEKVEHGSIAGRYRSKVSANDQIVEGSLLGTINGDAMGFVVNWAPTFESVTSWSGKLLVSAEGDLHIYTLWQLSRGGGGDDFWQSFLAGADTFMKTA